MPEFYQTHMGQKFYNGTMSSIAVSLETIASILQKPNQMTETELNVINAAVYFVKSKGELGSDIGLKNAVEGYLADK